MAEIINHIPGYENGTVWYLEGMDEVNALLLIAQMAQGVLNDYNTNVAVFSLTSRGSALQELVNNKSAVAKLYTVNQKNPNLQVILRKARGMVNMTMMGDLKDWNCATMIMKMNTTASRIIRIRS